MRIIIKLINNVYDNILTLQSIESFLQFLQEWENEAKNDANKFEFITNSTCYGLKITLRGALEICKFLVHEYGFKYLMTSRLNQDNLEVCTFQL